MAGFVVPGDWDETTWQEFKIRWPDSPEYWSLLSGQLSEFANEEVWDSETGNPAQAAQIGQTIINDNSTTGLFPEVYSQVETIAHVSRLLNQHILINAVPIPITGELVIAVGNSFQAPEDKAFVTAACNVGVNCVAGGWIRYELKDINYGTLFASRYSQTPSGLYWMTVDLSNQKINWVIKHTNINPYIAVLAQNAGNTITYSPTAQRAAKVDFVFDLTGTAIDMG